MTISMYQASVPRLANTLENLSNILDKAQVHVDTHPIARSGTIALAGLIAKDRLCACDRRISASAPLAISRRQGVDPCRTARPLLEHLDRAVRIPVQEDRRMRLP